VYVDQLDRQEASKGLEGWDVAQPLFQRAAQRQRHQARQPEKRVSVRAVEERRKKKRKKERNKKNVERCELHRAGSGRGWRILKRRERACVGNWLDERENTERQSAQWEGGKKERKKT